MSDDPKPEVVGGGMIAGGWVMFGVGTAAAFTLAVMSVASASSCLDRTYNYYEGKSTYNDCSSSTSDAETYSLAAYGMSAVATAGLVIAIVGHVRKGVSKGKLRDWEERHGIRESGAWPAASTVYADLHLGDSEPGSALVVPFATRDGGLGMALGGTF